MGMSIIILGILFFIHNRGDRLCGDHLQWPGAPEEQYPEGMGNIDVLLKRAMMRFQVASGLRGLYAVRAGNLERHRAGTHHVGNAATAGPEV